MERVKDPFDSSSPPTHMFVFLDSQIIYFEDNQSKKPGISAFEFNNQGLSDLTSKANKENKGFDVITSHKSLLEKMKTESLGLSKQKKSIK